MSDIEDYNMKIEVIKAITDDQIKSPKNIPPGIYIQEAEFLYTWCQDDKEELTAKGLDSSGRPADSLRCLKRGGNKLAPGTVFAYAR